MNTIFFFFCWFFKSLFVPFFPPQELPGYYYLLSVYAPTMWKKCSCWRKSVLRAETGHLFSLANSLQDFWCLKLKYPVPIKFNVRLMLSLITIWFLFFYFFQSILTLKKSDVIALRLNSYVLLLSKNAACATYAEGRPAI